MSLKDPATFNFSTPNKSATNCDDNSLESKDTNLDSANLCAASTAEPSQEPNNLGQDKISEAKQSESSNPAAFTITFDDDKASKSFGIRDSIRKFAPPKPFTIEKPRPQRSSQNQDCNLNCIDSNPDSFSNPEYHSNNSLGQISDVKKFLIDKMYEHSSLPPTSNEDRGVDLSDDKSDNGTYVIGADPESDAARSKIDELFGVVKAAEASLLAESTLHKKHNRPTTSSRPDYAVEHCDRRNHDQRVRTTKASPMSSSSSHQENDRVPRASRRSRNSSVDRTATRNNSHHRPKRSTSQASHNSSRHDASDGDTRSSLSSLQNFVDRCPPAQPSQPNMRFNRTVALRRARLGLDTAISGRQEPPTQPSESILSPTSLQSRLRGNQANHRGLTRDDRSSSASFNRDDGGRFSLRSKAPIQSNRCSSARHYPSSPKTQPQTQQAHCSSATYNKVHRSRLSEPISSHASANIADRNLQADTAVIDHVESDSDSVAQRFQYSLNTFDKASTSSRQTMAEKCIDFGGFQYGNALDSLVVSAISSLSSRISHSVCDILVEQARKLPRDNEVRLIVEETIPQLMLDSESPKSSSLVDRPLVCNDLSRTLKNLKKIEQMVDVINLISNQLPSYASRGGPDNNHQSGGRRQELAASSSSADNIARGLANTRRVDDSDLSPELNSMNDLSS